MNEFVLSGPRGDSALGFLVALGALVSLEDAGYRARLGWQRLSPRLVVSDEAMTVTATAEEGEDLVRMLHDGLRRQPGSGVEATEAAKKAMEQAKTDLKKRRDDIKTRKLDRAAAKEARRLEAEPLEQEAAERTRRFKELLAGSAVDPTITLGKNLTEPNSELIAHCMAACEQSEVRNRRWADSAAAYGVADPARPRDRMSASPWALISGGGHQNFLSSVQSLMVECSADHVRQALYGRWEATDEKYSLRLDTGEDRRYALMGGDPTASGNKPLTMWGVNRLAFEALRFFPCMPARRGMTVLGWQAHGGKWQDDSRVRWPLWKEPVGADVVKSLLGLRDLWHDGDVAARSRLRGLGVGAVMETRRIAVGSGTNKKYNLTPGAAVWADSSSADRAVPVRGAAAEQLD